MRKRIVIVDDHPVVRAGLRKFIEQEKGLSICAEADSAQAGFKAVSEQNPDLVIIDIALKEGSGLDLIKSLRTRWPDIRILVISLHEESIYAERCIRAGARGYVMKSELADKLLDAIRDVMAGKISASEIIMERLTQFSTPHAGASAGEQAAQLSDRELEVFQLLGTGRSVHEIAGKLNISKSTVETHRANIKTKLGIATAQELIARAATFSSQP